MCNAYNEKKGQKKTEGVKLPNQESTELIEKTKTTYTWKYQKPILSSKQTWKKGMNGVPQKIRNIFETNSAAEI